MPARQVWQVLHSTPLTPVWYVPPPHSSQANRPAALTYVPARQFPHTPLVVAVHPLVQTCPLRQAVHAWQDVNPLPVRYVPVAHPVQVVALVAGWNVPGEQSVQALASSPVWNRPTGQIWHWVEPVTP